MSNFNEFLENVIAESGGLSKFQALMIFVTLGSKVGPTWSMLMMTFAGYVPDFRCKYEEQNTTSALTTYNSTLNECSPPAFSNFSQCIDYDFYDNKQTCVNEWNLVCDDDHIPSIITTIQMGGLLVSGFAAGQMSDIIGRKPSFFFSLLLVVIFNIIAAFSTSWKMFAAVRFFIGFGCGCYLSVFYTYVLEFIPTKHRPLVMAFPSLAIWAAVLGGVSKWLHNWVYLHYATAIMAVPWIFFYWYLPESFRWLAANGKVEQSKAVIKKMATVNGQSVPDLDKLGALVEEYVEKLQHQKSHSIIDVVSNKILLKRTALIAICWLSCGYGYYAISFGVQSLSGDLYLNMFLLSFIEIPAQVVTYYLTNCMGRKWTTFMFFLIASVGACIVAILQISVVSNKTIIVSAFALTSKLGVAAGWASLMILTTELYPTVVRNVGFGLHNSVSRIGAMVAPQIVFLNTKVNGLMYFLCSAMMLLSVLSVLFLEETKEKPLENTISDSTTDSEIEFSSFTNDSASKNYKPA